MSLALVELPPGDTALPPEVQTLVDDAQQRIEALIESRRDRPIVAFVPSEFAPVYQVLACIAQLELAPGHRFAEWGSGVGVVSCLAAMLGLDAVGIEIEPDLVATSQALAADHAVDVQFVTGNFIPPGGEELTQRQGDIAWLRADGPCAYGQLDLEPDDFDLVFAYPWPGEEQIVFDLFERCSATGALLLTYHGQEGLQLRRKVSG